MPSDGRLHALHQGPELLGRQARARLAQDLVVWALARPQRTPALGLSQLWAQAAVASRRAKIEITQGTGIDVMKEWLRLACPGAAISLPQYARSG